MDSADREFSQQRSGTFDRILALLQKRHDDIPSSLLSSLGEIAPTLARQNADREVLSLFIRGLKHLKDGAPGGLPGSMTEALTKTSLRSSSLAAAVGIKPPQFVQIYHNVAYTNGFEAAVFCGLRLLEAAEGDIPKSRQMIQQKIFCEKPQIGEEEMAAFRKQTAMSANILLQAYEQGCRDIKAEIARLPPPPKFSPRGRSFEL